MNARDFTINGAKPGSLEAPSWRLHQPCCIHPSCGTCRSYRTTWSCGNAWSIFFWRLSVGRCKVSCLGEWRSTCLRTVGNPKADWLRWKATPFNRAWPKRDYLRLTESAVMSDSEHTLQMLNAIKKLGFALSIDDFNFKAIHRCLTSSLPYWWAQIDRAFISDIDTLPRNKLQ